MYRGVYSTSGFRALYKTVNDTVKQSNRRYIADGFRYMVAQTPKNMEFMHELYMWDLAEIYRPGIFFAD